MEVLMNKKLFIALAMLTTVAVQPVQAVTKKQIVSIVAGISLAGVTGYWLYTQYVSSNTELHPSTETSNPIAPIQQAVRRSQGLEDYENNTVTTQEAGKKKQQEVKAEEKKDTVIKKTNVRKKPRISKFDTLTNAFPEEKQEIKIAPQTTTLVTQSTSSKKVANNPNKPRFGVNIMNLSDNGDTPAWLKKTQAKQASSTKLSEQQITEITQAITNIKSVIDTAKNQFAAKDSIKKILKQLTTVTDKDVLAYNNKEIDAYAKQQNKANFLNAL
jgi:nitrous oxide reductase